MTPNGTRRLLTLNPLARVVESMVSLMGSGRAATLRTPSATSWSRSGVSNRRSSSASLRPSALAGFVVFTVRRQDFILPVVQGLGNVVQSPVLDTAGQPGQYSRRCPRPLAKLQQVFYRVGSHSLGDSFHVHHKKRKVIAVDNFFSIMIAQGILNVVGADALDPRDVL